MFAASHKCSWYISLTWHRHTLLDWIFPSSQINEIRGYKQLLKQECSLCSHHFQSSQQSLTSDWTRPLGRAATARALQKWNWSSKTTDHRLATVACLKSSLSPEVTVSATLHGHTLAQRTLTSINNFSFCSVLKWVTSFIWRGQNTVYYLHSSQNAMRLHQQIYV